MCHPSPSRGDYMLDQTSYRLDINPQSRRRSASLSAIPFASRRSCSIKSCSSDGRDVESEVDRCAWKLLSISKVNEMTDLLQRPDYRPRKPGLERARVHRILYSSSDSEEEQPLPAAPRHSNVDLGTIEITDSSDDEDLRRREPPLPACIGVASPLSTPGQRRDRSDDDDGLLVL